MFSQRKVSVSINCLFIYSGFILGFGLLVLAQADGRHDLGRWGIAALCVACTASVHRAIEVRDEKLWQAFELGRQRERQEQRRDLTSIR